MSSQNYVLIKWRSEEVIMCFATLKCRLYVFVAGSRMTAALLCFLLAGPVLLVAGGPVYNSNNGTVPLVLWHGMGEWLGFWTKQFFEESFVALCWACLLSSHWARYCVYVWVSPFVLQSEGCKGDKKRKKKTPDVVSKTWNGVVCFWSSGSRISEEKRKGKVYSRRAW